MKRIYAFTDIQHCTEVSSQGNQKEKIMACILKRKKQNYIYLQITWY